MNVRMPQGQNRMQVEVDKQTLLDSLRVNRAKHADTYDKAVKGYRLQAVQKLQHEISRFTEEDVPRVVWSLWPPENYLDEYDRALEMLEWHTDAHITISADDFARFVQDNWEWKHQFVASSSMYMS